MRKPLIFGLLISALASSVSISAFAQGGGGCQPGGGGTPGEGPLRRRFQGGEGGFRQGMKAHVPGERQVMGLSTLSQDQKQKLEGIYKASREQMKPLVEQRKQLKAQMESGGGGGAAGGGPGGGGPGGGAGLGGRGQFRQLMQQMKAIREDSWSKAQAVLTPAQISALQQAGPGPQGMPNMPGRPPGGPGGGGQMPDEEE